MHRPWYIWNHPIPWKGALAAEDKASGRVIGYLLCNEIQDDIYEIGWIFNRCIWRQGYAYEACCSLVDYAFFSLHAHKLLAETIDPLKSAGLMKKLGMELEGVQRGQVKDNGGQWVDLYLYGLLRETWEGSRRQK